MSGSSGSFQGFSPVASPPNDPPSVSSRARTQRWADSVADPMVGSSRDSLSPFHTSRTSASLTSSDPFARSPSLQGSGDSPRGSTAPPGSIPGGSGSDRASPVVISSDSPSSYRSSPSDRSATPTVVPSKLSKAEGKRPETSTFSPQTRRGLIQKIADKLEGANKQGPPKAPRTPKIASADTTGFLQANAPPEALKHATPPSRRQIETSPGDRPGPSRVLTGRDESIQSWSNAINSRFPCEACLRDFLKRADSAVPSLREDVRCMVTNSGSFRCDRCIDKHHSPCVMGDPLIVGSIGDLYFARAILKGIARGASPSLSISQENQLSISWIRLARTLMNLSANGPSGTAAFRKLVDNPKYKKGGKEKPKIMVPNESAIMETSIFRGQALANSHPLDLVEFSNSGSVQEKIMRDLLNNRRGQARLVPADNGFPVWHASVQQFLVEVLKVIDEAFGELPEGFLLLLQEMTHGMRTALPPRLIGGVMNW